MKDNILISIVVPVYNADKYLDRCIQSIVNQSYKNLEIVLIDDGSEDSSPRICDEWSKKDNRIIVKHKKNGGASSARNLGIDVSNGSFIGFIDSDDYISQTMIEELADLLISSKKKISFCRIIRVFADGREIEITHRNCQTEFDGEEAVKNLLYDAMDTSFCNKLFVKDLFQDIRFPEGEANEEYSLWIPMLTKADGIVGCNSETATYYYRTTEGSVTSVRLTDKNNIGIVYKNLEIIKKQIKELNLNCKAAYRYFAARNAYYILLVLDKKYKIIDDEMKSHYKKYKEIMWKYFFNYFFNLRVSLKDKMLYVLILSRLLRPLYSVFYKDHLKY